MRPSSSADRFGLERAVATLDRDDLKRTTIALAVHVGLTHLARPAERREGEHGPAEVEEPSDDGHTVLADVASMAADGDVDGLLVAVEASSDAALRHCLIDPIGQALEAIIEEHRKRP